MKLIDAMREYKKGCSNDPNCEECEQVFMNYIHSNYVDKSSTFKFIKQQDLELSRLKKPFPWFAFLWCFFCVGLAVGSIIKGGI